MSRNLDPAEPAGFPWKKLFLIVFVAGLCFVLGAGAGLVLLAKFGDFPPIESAAAYRPSVTSKIFDRNNRVVGEIYIEKRTVVPFKAIPPHVVNAFVAAEDANFFRHKGVDYVAIARAIVKDVVSGGYVQGASTITQQTVKSLFLTPEKSIARKLKELILAYRIEKKLSKEEILYLYLNQIYLGDGAYGVESAAQTYFSRGVSTLSVAEGALLAGLAQAPSRTRRGATSTRRRAGSGTCCAGWRMWDSSTSKPPRGRTTRASRSPPRPPSVRRPPTSSSTSATTCRTSTARKR